PGAIVRIAPAILAASIPARPRAGWLLTICWAFPGRGRAGRQPSCLKRTAVTPACPARLSRREAGRPGRRWWCKLRASSGLPAPYEMPIYSAISRKPALLRSEFPRPRLHCQPLLSRRDEVHRPLNNPAQPRVQPPRRVHIVHGDDDRAPFHRAEAAARQPARVDVRRHFTRQLGQRLLPALRVERPGAPLRRTFPPARPLPAVARRRHTDRRRLRPVAPGRRRGNLPHR